MQSARGTWSYAPCRRHQATTAECACSRSWFFLPKCRRWIKLRHGLGVVVKAPEHSVPPSLLGSGLLGSRKTRRPISSSNLRRGPVTLNQSRSQLTCASIIRRTATPACVFHTSVSLRAHRPLRLGLVSITCPSTRCHHSCSWHTCALPTR